MARAIDIAKFIIGIFSDKADYGLDNGMTNLRLQKLLYLAQGYYLAEYGKPLFDEEIEVWQYGPVVREVYVRYKAFHKDVLHDDPPADGLLTDEEEDFVLRILSKFGKYSTGYLVSLTHSPGTPWDLLYDGEKKKIDKSLILEHFKKKERLVGIDEMAESLAKNCKQVRGETGHIILPAEDYEEWEDSPDA